MTDQDGRGTADENQREAERSALRKLRAALDNIAKHELRAGKLEVGVGIAIIALIAVSFLALHDGHRTQRHNEYATHVERKIRVHLTIPSGVPATANTVVELTLSKTGAITDSRISKGSGIEPYDEAVRQAVSRATPFRATPAFTEPYRLQVQIGVTESR
jgi:TonB family protein